MRQVRRRWVSAVCVVVLSCGLAVAQQPSVSPPVDVDPKAEALIRKMSERAAKMKDFRFVVDDSIDEVRETGQKLQFSHRRFGTVSRPDKLKLRSVGDIRNRTIWKDGKTITMLDEDQNVYGQIEDPGTIDDMMDLLLERYGVSMPLADLLSSDVYEVLMGGVLSGEYVGLHHVGEIECHHLAFTQEEIDWQLWIDSGEVPELRKLLITYKRMPGEPQYTVIVQRLATLAEAPAGEFAYQLPPDADRIQLFPADQGGETEDTPPQSPQPQ